MSDLIPEEHRPALVKFTHLTKSAAEELIEALENAAPALLVGDVAVRVSKAAGLDLASVRSFLFMLASMARARAASGLSVHDFVEALDDAAKDSNRKLTTKDWETRKAYLARALATSAIQVTAKALQVVGEHPRFLCHARILSDLRPVFDDDTLEARAVVITHQLKIAYHEHGGPDEPNELFVAVDREDLMRLRTVIDRALGKHGKLEELAAKTELPVLSARNRS